MTCFTLLTFDCYGTLIDWELGMKSALKEILTRKGLHSNTDQLIKRYIEIELEIEQETYRKYKEILILGVKKLFAEKNIKLSCSEERVFADTIATWPPFKETKKALKRLKEKYRLAILSNVDNEIIKHSIELIGVEFDGVITAEMVRSYKPSHAHWNKLLELFKPTKKDEVLHVSSSYVHDVVPAKELGFKVAWINRKGEKRPGKYKPDYEFSNLTALADFLL